MNPLNRKETALYSRLVLLRDECQREVDYELDQITDENDQSQLNYYLYAKGRLSQMREVIEVFHSLMSREWHDPQYEKQCSNCFAYDSANTLEELKILMALHICRN